MRSQAVHIIARGKVQGVCYRACTQETAENLGLTGWVRNCADGSVEIHAEGRKRDLEKLAAWCQEGPPLAGVTAVDVTWVPAEGLSSFEIR